MTHTGAHTGAHTHTHRFIRTYTDGERRRRRRRRRKALRRQKKKKNSYPKLRLTLSLSLLHLHLHRASLGGCLQRGVASPGGTHTCRSSAVQPRGAPVVWTRRSPFSSAATLRLSAPLLGGLTQQAKPCPFRFIRALIHIILWVFKLLGMPLSLSVSLTVSLPSLAERLFHELSTYVCVCLCLCVCDCVCWDTNSFLLC